MEIKNEFTVDVPIDEAWAVLTDLAIVASCLPGAQLTGQEGDTYTGKVKIKVGPVVAEYAGTAAFIEKDDANYHAVIEASGRNATGAGSASAHIVAGLRPNGNQTIVSVDTDLSISGKIAQFGKSAFLEVSEKLMAQFVASLETKLTESQNAPLASAETPPAGPSSSEAPREVPSPPEEPEALDFMSIAGGAVYKRLIPLVVVVVVVIVVIVLLAR